MPKVSVIMPVYNGERFIEQAIDSLLEQSFQDWELVVIDDGSTDTTPQILHQYPDERIKVIRQKNSGEAGARNTGLKHINGEYMAFLDADDLYLPNALEDLSSFLDQNPRYGVVFSDGYIFDHQDRPLMRLTEVRPGIYTGNILDPLVMSPSVISVPVCTMTRVSHIRKYDLHFDETNNLIGTDWDFWIRLAVHVEFGYLDKVTCKYRVHTTNITKTTGSEKRRKDQIYRRLKILNSEWFEILTLTTRQLFFLDLLTGALSGDLERQQDILHSEQFVKLPVSERANLWRMAGIDVLKNSRDSDQAKKFFLQSCNLNSSDRKTRLLLWSLGFGRSFALMFVNIWQLLLYFGKKIAFNGNSQSERLQKLLGVW
jgi:glycosyltransferase involved in cell wall biosynthesis